MTEEQRKLLLAVFHSSTVDFEDAQPPDTEPRHMHLLDAYQWSRDAVSAVLGLGNESCEEVLARAPEGVRRRV